MKWLFPLMGGIALAGTWAKFGSKVLAAASVKKLDQGLYTLTYKGDYGFDEFLKRGGAADESQMAAYITEFLSGGFSKPPKPPKQAFGCSTLVSNGMMGRNFDWEGEPGKAMIVRTCPKHGYESVSTCWLEFLGFGKDWKPEGFANQYMALAAIYVPLDGINEKGLCVADLVNGDDERTAQDTGRVKLTTNTAIRYLLDRAANVDEALALLRGIDMNSAIGMSHHLAIADASGRSVVVEYAGGEMLVSEERAVTNHYLCPGEKQGTGNDESKARLCRLLECDVKTPEQMRDAMAANSYEGLTRWTNVFCMKGNKAKVIYYWDGEYDFGRSHYFVVPDGRKKKKNLENNA